MDAENLKGGLNAEENQKVLKFVANLCIPFASVTWAGESKARNIKNGIEQ